MWWYVKVRWYIILKPVYSLPIQEEEVLRTDREVRPLPRELIPFVIWVGGVRPN